MAVKPRTLLAGAGLCAAAFVVLLGFAYLSAHARWLDASALQGFIGLQRPSVSSLAMRVVSLGDPLPVALAGAVLAAVALVRGRPRTAVLVVALIGVTSVSSQALKALLAYPRDDAGLSASVAPAAFPSGHSTAAMALAVAFVMVMPGRLRLPAAVLGSALALGVSLSTVALGWHFPSDVVGGYLLAVGWAFVLLAALRAAAELWPERRARTLLAARSRDLIDRAAAVGVAAACAALAVLGLATAAFVALRRPDLMGYAQQHTAFVAVAGAVALSALALLGALAGTLARR